MKRFKGFVVKEFYHIFRDKRSLIILFGMPVVQIVLFGFAITNEIRNVDIAVLDRARDAHSTRIVAKVLSTGYFQLSAYLDNEKEIEKRFREGKIRAAIIFEPGLGRRFETEGRGHIQVITDATEPNTASSVNSYISAIVADYQQELNRTAALPMRIGPQLRMFYNPGLKSVFMFVPGIATVILMLVSAMMTSISIAREKETGTMEVLLVSPLRPFQVVLGKVFPYVFLAAINAVGIFMLGFFLFGMPFEGNFFALAAETLLFILTALSLGIFISTIADSQQTAMMISLMGLMLPTILLSGFIFPIESMPKALQVISNIIPARWFIVILKGLLLKGVGVAYLWKETLILVATTGVLILLSIRRYKIRLE